ncbi:phage tail tape measure protein [Billgrantia montanilacus]|uniref:Phage tail tape measure protein n=1 Tax=Billgrantia montanilacus TaxID=2282305 RepID=A0A368U1R4_9GAMM|nr:phage tail tape measure protein [Halomonas montanilacus]RCV90496.1 phage tail tape measure protein [Halomonas montanilacus]
MADLEKSVAIIFEGVDAMGAGVTSVTRQLDNVAGSVQGAAQPLADFTYGVLKAQTALLATGAAVTGLAVKVSGDFDASFREITTLLDESGDSLDGLRSGILDYATDSTQSIDTITGAYYNLISAGNDTTEAMTLLGAAEQLAVGGKTDLDTAAKSLAGTLSAYGAEASEASDYTDTLFVAMANGMTTIGELASGLPNITGLASQLGVDFDTLSSAVSALTTTGLSTSQAVTQVGAALNSIMGPSQQARTLAEELGIEFSATALRSMGLADFMDMLAEATGGSEEQMRTLFGSSEATKGMLSLMGPVAEAFADGLEDMENKAGATATAFEKMAGTVEQGSQKIKNAMTVALINLGDPLLDSFGGIQEAIAAIFNAIGISLNDGQLNQFVEQLESVFQAMEAKLQAVAANLPEALESADWSGFLNGIEAIREAIGGIFNNADITSAEGLASVIETLGTGFEMLSQYTAGTITALVPFIEQLADLASWIMKIDPEWVALMGKIGGGAVVLTTVLSVFSSLLGIINGLAGAKGAIPAMTAATGKLAAVMGATGAAGLVGAAGLAAGALVYLTGKATDYLLGIGDIEEAQGKLLDAVDESAKGMVENYDDLFDAIEDGTVTWDHATGQWIKSTGEVNTALGAMVRETDEAANSTRTISEAAVQAAQSVAGTGTSIMEGVNAWNEWRAALAAANQQAEQTEQAHSTNADTLWSYINGIEESAEAWEKLNDNTYQAVDNSRQIEEALGKVRSQFEAGMIDEDAYDAMVATLGDMKTGSIEAGEGISIMGKDMEDAGKQLDKTTGQALDLEMQLNELASNQRIKAMEFTADLQIAQVEAETKRLEVMFDSLDNTITSTGETLESLTGNLAGFSSRHSSGYREMLEIIKNEEKRRDKAIDAQVEHVKASTENMQARTKALQDGDGLIKIESDGLEPALEMIMWNIIERVQLRANAEGAEFLLGLNGPGGGV